MNIPPDAWRAVPIEDMREWYREESAAESIRTVSGRAGVEHSTLHNFVSRGSIPHPRIRRKLAALYLRSAGARRTVDNAVSVLLAGLPPEHHARAVQGVVDAVTAAFSGAGLEPPSWVRS